MIVYRRYLTDPERGHDLHRGNGHRDWSCHWPVRGHARWQPTKNGRKLIWIDGYVKGDLTKPFRGGDDMRRVFSVER